MAELVNQYTAQIVPDTKTTISNQYFDLNQPFAFPRYGNECEAFINGRDYMKAVANAIRAAKSFIMITDWQLDYDVELDNRGDPKHPGRVSELLADAVQRGVHVRVMLYDSVAYALDTHDDTTQPKLDDLPAAKGSIKVLLQNPNTGRSPSTRTRDANFFFSHHQKSVIVDGELAFLGGLDLAYGRWDTNACDVIIDRRLHVLNDAYNGQLNGARAPTAAELTMTRDANGRPGFAPPYKTNGNSNGQVLDQESQPRQPWQDVALSVRGPAAFDVFCNFVLRWNSSAGSFSTNFFDGAMDTSWFERARGQDHLVDPLKRGAGGVNVQICRSASSAQLGDELRLWDNNHKYVNDDWKAPNPQRRRVVQAARAAWRSSHQTSIRDAMVNCIRAAQAFIYIENQFFVSNCGADQNGTAAPATNPIIAELAAAVAKAIYAGRPFHIYIVLPEHPEGHMEEDGTKSQTWWALQGIKRGSSSLISRINATLVEKNMKAWGLTAKPASNEAVRLELSSHGMLNEWAKYLTVLNVRNYGKTATNVLTEMVYVHSKLMIVDDAVAIIGSANINDRSLNGNGDTELAAVVVDTAQAEMTDVGGGIKCITRQFARDLRKKLWQKHLGMLVDQKTTGVQKRGAPAGVDVDTPLDAATIAGIKKLAMSNRETYNAVFVQTARDSYGTLMEGRDRGFLTSYRDSRGEIKQRLSLTATPPLQPEFMDDLGKHKVEAAIMKLSTGINGFWVQMPLNWGVDEAVTPRPPLNAPSTIAELDHSAPSTRDLLPA